MLAELGPVRYVHTDVARFLDVELVTSDEPSYRPANFVSGYESLPVRRAH